MAQAVFRRDPNEIEIKIASTAPTPKQNQKQEDIILDWNSFLHSLWLGIMKTNPEFYDDAMASTIVKPFLSEVQKKK